MRVLLTSLLIAALAFVSVISAGSWLLYTPGGTDWLLGQVQQHSSGRLQIGSVEGALLGDLALEELSLTTDQGDIEIAQLRVQAQIRTWLPLHLAISDLQIKGVTVRLAEADPAAARPVADLLPPELPFWPWLKVDLEQLQLQQVSLVSATGPTRQLESLSASARLHGETFEVDELAFVTETARGAGRLALQLDNLALDLTLELTALRDDLPWQAIAADGQLQKAERGDGLSGPLRVQIDDIYGQDILAQASLSLADRIIRVDQLQLRRRDRPGSLQGDLKLTLAAAGAELAGQLQLAGLDLGKETGQPLKLSGTLEFTAQDNAISGRFALDNQGSGPTKGQLQGAFEGTPEAISLTDLDGHWLSGQVRGQVQASRVEQGWQLGAELSGRELDPQQLQSQLAGRLNLTVKAHLSQQAAAPLQGRLEVKLADSMLQGYPLSGQGLFTIAGDQLTIEETRLQGQGVTIEARGNPRQRLDFSWQVNDLGNLFSGAGGSTSGQGWAAWQQGSLSGDLEGRAAELSFQEWSLLGLSFSARSASLLAGRGQVRAELQNLRRQQSELAETIQLDWTGSLAEHQLELNLQGQPAQLRSRLTGGWRDQQWQGTITDLQLTAAQWGDWTLAAATPLMLSAARIRLESLALVAEDGARIELQGSHELSPRQSNGALVWQDLDLAMARPWLAEPQIGGQSSGQIAFKLGRESSFSGQLQARGDLAWRQFEENGFDLSSTFSWDRSGLQAELALQLADRSAVEARLSSAEAAHLGVPRQGRLEVRGQRFSLERLQPWLPPGLVVAGWSDWQSTGRWTPDRSFALTGELALTESSLSWQDEELSLSIPFQKALASWQWDERLRIDLQVDMEHYGHLQADLDLPIRASLPLAGAGEIPLQGELDAELTEPGLLATFFPAQVQNSQAQLNLKLRLSGTWDHPELQGRFGLKEGQVFLNPLGIQLKDLTMDGRFASNRLIIDQLGVTSGPGHLSGTGAVELVQWRPDSFQLQLTGERFELINLPERQVLVSPELSVQGQPGSVSLRGTVTVPEAWLEGKQNSAVASNSSDLVIVDRPQPESTAAGGWSHDVELQLILGDQVVIKSSGLDARLAGELAIFSAEGGGLAANGEIRVAKGRYTSYGVKLDIQRGLLSYSGGPLQQPALDVLAARTVREVTAGVKVTGTPQQPLVELYSQPSMSDTETLSYIVLGRPLERGGGDNDLLLTAAGALLSQGESVQLQEKLQRRLGLDIIELDSGGGDVEDATLTTGKYLSPDVYVSLGYSLFKNTSELNLRYRLLPNWELESSIGLESGVDLYHLLEIE